MSFIWSLKFVLFYLIGVFKIIYVSQVLRNNKTVPLCVTLNYDLSMSVILINGVFGCHGNIYYVILIGAVFV